MKSFRRSILKVDEGIILRRTNFKESSLILKIFTRNYGKITLLALGARRPGNSLKEILHHGYVLNILYYKKEDKEIGKLKEGSILWKPEKLLYNYKIFLLFAFFLKILDIYLTENPVFRELYINVKDILVEIDELKNLTPNIFFSIMFKFFSFTGISPEFEICIKCKKRIKIGYFFIKEGGIICNKCSDTKSAYFFDFKKLNLTRFLIKKSLKEIERLKDYDVDFFRNFILDFSFYYLGNGFKKEIEKSCYHFLK